jgi:hypothetical protein
VLFVSSASPLFFEFIFLLDSAAQSTLFAQLLFNSVLGPDRLCIKPVLGELGDFTVVAVDEVPCFIAVHAEMIGNLSHDAAPTRLPPVLEQVPRQELLNNANLELLAEAGVEAANG